MSDAAIPPFFIVGVQRSGTTLLRLILNAHSKIAIPEEARFLAPLLRKRYITSPLQAQDIRRTIEYLQNNPQFQLWNYDTTELFSLLRGCTTIHASQLIEHIYSSYAKSENKASWGDKSLFFDKIQILREYFPSARFIHIVRDGRDVFDSWRKMDPTRDNPAVAAVDWSAKIRLVESSFSLLPPDKHLTIRYEDLLSDSEGVTRLVCEFLGIEFEDNMLQFHRSSDKYIGAHHSELIFRSIDSNNREKWRTNLTVDERYIFELFAKNTLAKYEYALSDKNRVSGSAIKAYFQLAIGIPARALNVALARLDYILAYSKGRSTKVVSVGEKPKQSKH